MIKKSEAKVLVVDDQPINIKLLQRKLERQGMQVLVAYNGRECLDVVAETRPDLILLDVMMPEMDGIEACAHLKSNPDTETIPIIFITAKASKEGKLEGLSAGAVDYITKPIDLDETLARVNTQLRLQEMFRENLELQRRLGESRRAAAVGAITQGIAHNLNNLLGVVVGYLDLIKSGYDSADMVKRSVMLMDHAINRMVSIIRQLSSIASNEKIELSPQNLRELLLSSIERFKTEYNLSVDIPVNLSVEDDFTINANAEVFESILGKLLINAWESYPKKFEGEREIGVDAEVIETPNLNRLIIRVSDRGNGIPKEVEDTLFEPFITTKTSVGRGMGLTIVRHTLRNLGAEITLEPRPEGGTAAIITYPL